MHQDETYQREYNEAMAKLEAEAAQVTTPRGQDGRFTKAETPTEASEPQAEVKPEQASQPEAVKPEVTPEVKPEASDPVAELKAQLEKAQKALKDTQAWGTKNAQRLKELEAERERQQREANKPAILEQAPELEEAIKYVTHDPEREKQTQLAQQREQWMTVVDAAHPGIFSKDIDPELEQALVAKAESLGESWFDPLVAIREITAEKLAHSERQIGKRFAAESAKLQQKSAMSVPGAGGGAPVAAAQPSPLDDAQRILNMSPAEFEREVRRVKGY